MDEYQTPRPEGDIRRGKKNRRNIKLFFNSCQRRMYFSITLKNGVGRPDVGKTFGFRLVMSHSRNVALSPVEASIATSKLLIKIDVIFL